MKNDEIKDLIHKLGLVVATNMPEHTHLYQVYKRGKEITDWMTRKELVFWIKGYDYRYRDEGNRYYHFNENGVWTNE